MNPNNDIGILDLGGVMGVYIGICGPGSIDYFISSSFAAFFKQ